MVHPRPVFIYFQSFQTTVQILQHINVKNDPSSIMCRDSNSQPLDHESPTITTRPGLGPICENCFARVFFRFCENVVRPKRLTSLLCEQDWNI